MGEEVNPLRESLINARVMSRNGYRYLIHPLTDGVPDIRPELLEHVTDRLERAMRGWQFNKIVTVEAMGIPVATAVALRTGHPLVVIRKRPYGMEGEVPVAYTTGYSGGHLYINSIGPGDRVAVVDDILSTGNTLRSVVRGLERAGAEVVGVAVVIDKGGRAGEMERELGVPVVALAEVRVSGERVEVVRA